MKIPEEVHYHHFGQSGLLRTTKVVEHKQRCLPFLNDWVSFAEVWKRGT